MARVFVSYASKDLARACEVHGWLVEAGHEVFLDQDPRDGIVVGEQWRTRLHERLRWADAVVCVVTSTYLASTWCTAEIVTAQLRGSRLLPLRAEPNLAHPLLTEVQHTDLTQDPIAAHAALIAALRQIDAAGGSGWPDDRSPFPGLRPFDVDRHRVFFGRADEVKHLTELLRSPVERAEGATLLVVGPSGCGKSSLVRAGLLPVLADHPGWRTLPPILPGTDPVAALARELAAAARRIALDWTVDHVRHQLDQRGLTGLADELLLADPAGPQQRLLIVVDQFEELLTQTTPTERARFTELLRSALTGPVRVVATLRPEFLDQLLVDPELATLPTRTSTLRPLRREALRAVIEKPAQLAGIYVDDGLVDRLVDDTDSGEALPLLAFTLAQLAEGISRGGRLSSAHYDQLGGVRGALIRQADAALTDAVTAGGRSREQVIAGLLRLVTVDEQGRPTRWRVLRDELPTPVITELDAFVERRLLTTDEGNGSGVVGVAHEAFLSAWLPLNQAITTAASALRARRAVEHASTEWNDNGRPPARLWGGGQLAAAATDTGARICTGTAPADTPPRRGPSRWLPQRHHVLVTDHVDLSTKARDFLHASIRRDRYRRRRATTILSVLLILALIGAAVAVSQRDTAQEQQRLATARQLVVQAETALKTDPQTALQLGIAARQIHRDAETHSSLINLLTSTPYAGTLIGSDGTVNSTAFSPDGRTLATGAGWFDGTVILWDFTDRSRPRRLGQLLTNSGGGTDSVSFSPDGRTLAIGGTIGSGENTRSVSGAVTLWDLGDPAHPRRIGESLTHDGPVTSVAFSSSGQTLATSSYDSSQGGYSSKALLWDLSDPAAPRRIGQPLTGPTSVDSVSFSPDGHVLVTVGGDAILWDVADPTLPRRVSQPLNGGVDVSSAAFSPNGRMLATGSSDGTIMLWDLVGRTKPRQVDSPLVDDVNTRAPVTFSPDGHILATGSRDDTVRSTDDTVILWDLADPARPRRIGQPLPGHTSFLTSAAFSPNGRTLATGSNNIAILWDLTDPAQPRRVTRSLTHQKFLGESLAFSPDGRILATRFSDVVILWDVTDPARPQRLWQPPSGDTDRDSPVAFSPDGHILATGSDGAVILWDITEPARPRRLGSPLEDDSGYPAFSVAFSPDGRALATGNYDGSAMLWDLADSAHPQRVGQLLAPHGGHQNFVAFSPDGRTLVTNAEEGIVLWDLSDSARPRRLGQPLGFGAFMAFAPDGRTLATSNSITPGGFVTLWDLTALNYLRDHAAERACAITRGGLDRDEWARYIPGLPYQDTCPA